ncbi:maleylacetoacetate isomerase [Caballeronia hypogeia]|uniref:Maleylacetoacetate isomerase n=1 Tax=Caballeronia hypogeia TaxID=1777140 RepID=A0A158D0G6_9BURK|nr:maleylacetoacetate isomerase [Caballeronia hypogeia]SAK87367.1 maleylacetoacetate isomerase [Caballeronia hypogeia]
MSGFTLHGYFRSSASFRVRIALNLKGVAYDQAPVHLVRDGGEQLQAAFRALNPDALVPALTCDDGSVLTQSLAIIEYLEERYPTPALLPGLAADRAFVRAAALQIACEIHPLDNLRVLKYLKQELGASEAQKDAWYSHWIHLGFASLEARLASDSRVGSFVFGDAPTLADICLVPQVWNARRFAIPLSDYPTIVRIADHAMQHDAFAAADPARQPDAST